MLFLFYKKATAHKVGWPYDKVENPPCHSVKVWGGFSMYIYLHECKKSLVTGFVVAT